MHSGERRSRSELFRAAADNHEELLRKFLVDGGSLEDLRNDERQTLLHVAAIEGALEVLALLLRHPRVLKKINSRDRSNRTALHLAAAMGYSTCVQRLLEANATLDIQDDKGCTALHLAVKFDWSETARLLLDAGSDPLVEDVQGTTVLDIANEKRDDDAARLIASFARRRPPSALRDLKRCLFPQWIFGGGGGGSRRPDQSMEQEPVRDRTSPAVSSSPWQLPDGGERGDSSVQADGQDDVCQNLQYPTSGDYEGENDWDPGYRGGNYAASHNQKAGQALSSAIAEVDEERCQQRSHPSHGQRAGDEPQESEGAEMEIEWHGLEPVLVPRRGGTTASSSRSGKENQQEVSFPHVKKDVLESGNVRTSDDTMYRRHDIDERAAEEISLGRARSVPPIDDRSPALPVASLSPEQGSPFSDSFEEFAMFRFHAYFDDSVKRLEFEVEWTEGQPAVGKVMPRGAADQRGIIQGDRLIDIGDTRTSGRGREQLLPLLKTRPLLLKIEREDRVVDLQEPHVELKLAITHLEGHGIDIAWRGDLPVVGALSPLGAAWKAGVMEGDALLYAGDTDVARTSRSSMLSALEERPVQLLLWRRPLGMDLSAPWYLQEH